MPKTIHRARLAYAAAIDLDAEGNLPSEIKMLPTGTFDTTKYGEVSLTDENFDQAVANFNSGIPKSGVPINLQHQFGEAAGWIKQLIHKPGEGMFAAVDWTKLGKEKLTERLYRFFSSEWDYEFHDPQTNQPFGFVVTGGALTNYPLFSGLPALAADSDSNTSNITILFSREGASMNLDEIRAKDADQLTDEEKAFVTEHASDLNADERTKFGVEEPAEPAEPATPAEPETPSEPETPAEPVQAEMSQGKTQEGQVTLSQTRLAALEKAANDGQKAMIELNQQRMQRDVVEPMVFSASNKDGVFRSNSKSKLSQFVFGLKDDAQRKQFKDLMAELPKTLSSLTAEIGDGGKSAAVTPGDQLLEMAQARVAEAAKSNTSIELSQALEDVSRENPELVAAEYSV